ncbi:TlpA family protein disulfide reductase [Sphingobacterium anhuiense]|uniref:TlpA family protein disulfide reductase n=1 Tax=Sphingobacterium anhuiense TaxID=493780 RepID=A0ABW5YQ96_9SPHI
MKNLFITLLAIFAVLFKSNGQTKLSGQLSNYKSDYKLTLRLSNATVKLDSTIGVSSDGKFAVDLQDVVQEPSFAILSLSDKDKSSLLFLNLYIAPDYSLKLTANIKDGDPDETKKSVVIDGKGKHLSQLYLTPLGKRDTINWLKKDIKTYVDYLNNVAWVNYDKRVDSLLKEDPSDPSIKEWRSIFKLNKEYSKLHDFIANYCYNNTIPSEKSQIYLKDLGFPDLWNQLNQDENLKSSAYRSFVEQIFLLEDEGLIKYPGAVYQKINATPLSRQLLVKELFTGKVRDYVLEYEIRVGILNTHQLAQVDSLQTFIPWITNGAFRDKLQKLVSRRKAIISEIKPGNKISKAIKLKNTITNDTLTLEDLKGKMVFLESWASWCGPCKEEIPHLKKLVEHYKDNPNIAFISVAAFDDKEKQVKNRLKIIKDQNMNWTQLEDIDNNFTAYFKIHGIPHNVILDKKGVIVDNDSIRPSNPGIIAYIDKLLSQK